MNSLHYGLEVAAGDSTVIFYAGTYNELIEDMTALENITEQTFYYDKRIRTTDKTFCISKGYDLLTPSGRYISEIWEPWVRQGFP